MKKSIISIILVLAIAMPMGITVRASPITASLALSAESALLMDASDGSVLYEKNAHPCGFEKLNDFSCQNIEKSNIFKCANHRQNAKKAGQGFKIEIVNVSAVRWDDKGGDQGGYKGDNHNRIFLYKGLNNVNEEMMRPRQKIVMCVIFSVYSCLHTTPP